MSGLKAYAVTDVWGDGYARIAFAKHAVTARREGASELGCEFGDVSCRRASWADSYAPGPVPIRTMIEVGGWWYECSGCDEHVDSETESPVYEEDKARVWCSEGCREQFRALQAAQKAEEEAKRKAATDAVLARFQWAEIDYVADYCGKTRVWFRFPGGQGTASWVPGDGTVSVERRDLGAFRALVPEPPTGDAP